jgi:hypothetical protein
VKEVECVAIDKEVKTVLDEHGQRIQQQDQRIQKLENQMEFIVNEMSGLKTEFAGVISVANETKNTVVNLSGTLISTFATILTNKQDNNTVVATTKMNNKTKIILKVLGVIGTIVLTILGSFMAARYGINIQ